MNKIDLIIDALEDIDSKWSYRKRGEALAAARELKALKPVAYLHCGNNFSELSTKTLSQDDLDCGWIELKLYALEVTK
jgi:hypothetical protein